MLRLTLIREMRVYPLAESLPPIKAAPEPAPPTDASALVAPFAALALAACGGGGDAGPAPSPTPNPTPTPPATAPTDAEAARFLAQAAMGITRVDIARVKAQGYAAWLDEQFALPQGQSRWDWLKASGFDNPDNRNGVAGFDATAWRPLLAAQDTLRQRMTLALSEIIVVGLDGLVNGGGWRAFCGAAWLDLLESHAFGNLRTLLGAVSTSVPMGLYLTFRGNSKADPAKGSLPDENYARELMQLFTIGLVQLNSDGTPKSSDGQTQDTYTQDDIAGLARVFTGWDIDRAGGTLDTPNYHQRAMAQVAARYETGAKTFLGTTIAAGTAAQAALDQALDVLFNHPNIAPFWSRQLIQRFVTSNPSPAYVQRVANVFANDGSGQRGNLRAVLRAVLLDAEARAPVAATDTTRGKLREPILRFTAWARAFGTNSPGNSWGIGNTSDPGTRLGQSPLRSASVFNFFRPGYVPPNSSIGSAQLVAPEFQITNESSVIGYINYMQRTVAGLGIGDVRADYSTLMPLADDTNALVAELDLLLAAGQLTAATRSSIVAAVESISTGNDSARTARIHAALTLVLASPEFLVIK